MDAATAVRSSLSVGMLERELPSDWRSRGVPARCESLPVVRSMSRIFLRVARH